VTLREEMIHLFSRSRGGSLQDPRDYSDEYSGDLEKILVSSEIPYARKCVRILLHAYGVDFFFILHGSLSRSRILRNLSLSK